MKRYYCNEVNDKHIKNTVKVFGWVAKRRDHGGIIFIDLRDHTGIVQLVFNPDDQGLFKLAESIRSEYVICVEGIVSPRLEGAINSEIASSIEELKSYLINQLTHPVKWVDTMNYIKQFNGVIIECGPGKVLSGLAKGNNINDNVYSTSSSNFIEEIEKAI